MIIQQKELSQKIESIKSIVPKSGTVPAIQGILLRDGFLTATNHEITIKVRLECAEKESFIIPQKAFDLIKNLPDGEIEISSDENHAVIITAGSINNTFQSIDPELFEAGGFPEKGNSGDMSLDSAELKKCIRNVLYAVDKHSIGQKLGALCIGCSDGYLNFAGTDSHVMAWDKVQYDGEEMELLVPRAAADKILQLDFDGEVQITSYGNSAVFATEEYIVKTSLLKGPYFSYRKMFTDLPIHVTADRKGLTEAVGRAAMCIDPDVRIPIRFRFEAGSVRIFLEARNAQYSETLPVDGMAIDPILIAFNPKLLIETLKAFDTEKVNISLAGEKKPLIMDADGMNLRSIVLPVNIVD